MQTTHPIANTTPQTRTHCSLLMLICSGISALLHVCFDGIQTSGMYQVGVEIVLVTAEVSMEGDEIRCSLHVCSRCSVHVDQLSPDGSQVRRIFCEGF
jgi:hypothetical protein